MKPPWAGWGRIKYVNDQFSKRQRRNKLPERYGIPKWDDEKQKIRDYEHYLDMLESAAFFSYPMDLDFAMLLAYPEAITLRKRNPDDATIKLFLEKSLRFISVQG